MWRFYYFITILPLSTTVLTLPQINSTRMHKESGTKESQYSTAYNSKKLETT